MFLFGLAPRSGPEGTGWPRSWGYKVDVYSIYKETRSSEEPGARERHYAGWAADQDDAKRRADEIYEGRDSTEAVVVIGNGPTGVEVVYRLDGEN
jgi:NADH dehydrogenase FAD-containing subunit